MVVAIATLVVDVVRHCVVLVDMEILWGDFDSDIRWVFWFESQCWLSRWMNRKSGENGWHPPEWREYIRISVIWSMSSVIRETSPTLPLQGDAIILTFCPADICGVVGKRWAQTGTNWLMVAYLRPTPREDWPIRRRENDFVGENEMF